MVCGRVCLNKERRWQDDPQKHQKGFKKNQLTQENTGQHTGVLKASNLVSSLLSQYGEPDDSFYRVQQSPL
jgi:hypothetical protein